MGLNVLAGLRITFNIAPTALLCSRKLWLLSSELPEAVEIQSFLGVQLILLAISVGGR